MLPRFDIPSSRGGAAGAVLFRDQSEPGTQIARFLDAACISHCSHQGRSIEKTYAGDTRQSTHGRIIACKLDKFSIQGFDLRIEALPLHTQIANQLTHTWR